MGGCLTLEKGRRRRLGVRTSERRDFYPPSPPPGHGINGLHGALNRRVNDVLRRKKDKQASISARETSEPRECKSSYVLDDPFKLNDYLINQANRFTSTNKSEVSFSLCCCT